MTTLGHWLGGSPFGSDVWDPLGFGTSQGRRDRGDDDQTGALAHAHVDWRETENAHIFHADLPGLRKEEVKVHAEDGNILQISGETTKEQEDENDKWHRVERSRGSYVRRFRLPDNANMDEIKCSLDHGVLTVTVPKKNPDQQASKNVRYIDIV